MTTIPHKIAAWLAMHPGTHSLQDVCKACDVAKPRIEDLVGVVEVKQVMRSRYGRCVYVAQLGEAIAIPPSRPQLVAAYIKEHGPTQLTKACEATGTDMYGWSVAALKALRREGVAISDTYPRIAYRIGDAVPSEALPVPYEQKMLACFTPGKVLTTDEIAATLGDRKSTFYMALSRLVKERKLDRVGRGCYKLHGSAK